MKYREKGKSKGKLETGEGSFFKKQNREDKRETTEKQ
jgi:hypothetical protein